MKAAQILKELKAYQDLDKKEILMRFFKTGKGEYGEGDQFLGVTVPYSRAIAKVFRALPWQELSKVLQSKWHEMRLVALLILVEKFKKADAKEKVKIIKFYLEHTQFINNWDLVDLSVYKILGEFLREDRDRKILYRLARSKNLWERRMSVIATFAFIRQADFSDVIKISKILLNDSHDLIHKAVGWMLREVGKRDEVKLKEFLDLHASDMPRTMLRYAIEKLSAKDRKYYLGLKA